MIERLNIGRIVPVAGRTLFVQVVVPHCTVAVGEGHSVGVTHRWIEYLTLDVLEVLNRDVSRIHCELVLQEVPVRKRRGSQRVIKKLWLGRRRGRQARIAVVSWWKHVVARRDILVSRLDLDGLLLVVDCFEVVKTKVG